RADRGADGFGRGGAGGEEGTAQQRGQGTGDTHRRIMNERRRFAGPIPPAPPRIASFYRHEAIDMPGIGWQDASIHRDRRRDRPFDAGATTAWSRRAATGLKVPSPAGTCVDRKSTRLTSSHVK